MIRYLLACLLLVLAMLVGESAALAYTVDFCAWYNVDFEDSDYAFGDDYFTNNNDKPARGAHLKKDHLYRLRGWSDHHLR